jgi:uncharacterized protein
LTVDFPPLNGKILTKRHWFLSKNWEFCMFIHRNLEKKLKKALKRSPVVLLTGARQTGKTTLIKTLCNEKNYSYVTFDNVVYLAAAQNDPIGFISDLEKPTILDEVQRVPELFLSIKNYVDQNRSPGIFALTGSANPLLIPKLGDSLAGRMEILELYPFSQGELEKKHETFIDNLFSAQIPKLTTSKLSKELLYKKLIKGGYPPVQQIDTQDRDAWFNSYLATILQRDVKDLAQIEGLTQLPNLLQLIATRTSSMLNVAELSRSSGIPTTTLNRYITLLKTLFLITLQQPWHANLSKRLVKSPKVYIADSGLLLHLLKADENRLATEPKIFGKAFENFIVTELLKQVSWNKNLINLFHYRTTTGIEVDIVLENIAGQVVGIEIKGNQTCKVNDFKGLKHLQETVGKNFVAGIVLYTGDQKIPFGNNLWAVPVSSLWG